MRFKTVVFAMFLCAVCMAPRVAFANSLKLMSTSKGGVFPYDFNVTQKAWQIQNENEFGWWDCTLLASALLAGCELFLSEDMQHGRRFQELVIENPFPE